MAMDAMTARPYVNPANFYMQFNGTQRPLPEHRHRLRNHTFSYYGGIYPDLGFMVYAPLAGRVTFSRRPVRRALRLSGNACLFSCHETMATSSRSEFDRHPWTCHSGASSMKNTPQLRFPFNIETIS